MSSKIRALVWEELRVGGSIVAMCLAVGLVGLLRLRFGSSQLMHWEDALNVSHGIAVGLPLMCALLLVLSLHNSGHLGGGFSRRILRMPVGTAAAVTVPMAVRLFEVMALGTVLILAFGQLFGQHAGWRMVFVLGMFYLLVQAVDWVRALATWLVFALMVALTALALQYTGRWVWFFDFLDAMDRANAPVFLIGFAGVAGACFVVSLLAVRRARQGWRIDPSKGATAAELVGWRGSSGEGTFASPQAAQFWYEMRRTRLLLPKAAFAFWLLGAAGYWVYTCIEHYGATETRPTTGEVFTSIIVTELIPMAALLLAAVVWRMQTSWIGWRESRQSASGWMARHPVTKAQVARARLAVAGVNIGIALGMAAGLYIGTFLLCDRAAILRLLGDAWALGATSPREVAIILLGPVLLAGLLTWIVMQLPNAIIVLFFVVSLLALSPELLIYDVKIISIINGMPESFWHRIWSNPVPGLNEARFTALILAFPIILYLLMLATTLRLGWIRWRSALLSMALWLGLAWMLFPFKAPYQGEQHSQAVLMCLSIAALAVASWPEAVLRGAGGLRVALRRQSRAQLAREAATVSPGRRMLGAALLLGCCAGVAWLRWPATPAAESALRARGIPATLTELNASYKPVPREENLAEKYRVVKNAEGALEYAWKKAHGVPAKDYHDQGDIWSKVLVQGGADVKRTEQITQDVWVATKEYWDMVGQPIAEKLHTVAQSGLHKSRYPTDLREGPGTLMEHLAPLRRLARILEIEGLVAAVERHPHEAVTSVLDTFPIAESLAEEPLLLSQLVRVAIMNIALANLENVLNRCNLPDEELVRLATSLGTALPPFAEGFFLDRAVAGEECFMICGTEHPDQFLDFTESGRPDYLWSSPGRQAFSSAVEIAGIGCLDRAVIALFIQGMMEANRAAAKTGVVPDTAAVDFRLTQRLRYHAPLAPMTLSSSGRWYEVEWRIRTQVDMARTALAVERYRLANGRLPQRLEELVPAFLERVPTDPWNAGKPLSYRVKENGEYVVYTVGQNRTDEKGEEMQNWWSKGDATFTVAPIN